MELDQRRRTQAEWDALIARTESRIGADYPDFAWDETDINGNVRRRYYATRTDRDDPFSPDAVVAEIQTDRY